MLRPTRIQNIEDMKILFTTLLLVFTVMASYAHDVEIDGIYYNLIPKAKEAIVK